MEGLEGCTQPCARLMAEELGLALIPAIAETRRN
jgi:hypothetical protein